MNGGLGEGWRSRIQTRSIKIMMLAALRMKVLRDARRDAVDTMTPPSPSVKNVRSVERPITPLKYFPAL